MICEREDMYYYRISVAPNPNQLLFNTRLAMNGAPQLEFGSPGILVTVGHVATLPGLGHKAHDAGAPGDLDLVL